MGLRSRVTELEQEMRLLYNAIEKRPTVLLGSDGKIVAHGWWAEGYGGWFKNVDDYGGQFAVAMQTLGDEARNLEQEIYLAAAAHVRIDHD